MIKFTPKAFDSWNPRSISSSVKLSLKLKLYAETLIAGVVELLARGFHFVQRNGEPPLTQLLTAASGSTWGE